MNKLQPKNRICFQNKDVRANLRLHKHRNKKWNILRRQIRKYPREFKTENRKKFFQKRLFAKQQFQFFYQVKYYQIKNLFKFFKDKKKKHVNIFNQFVFALDSRLDISLVRLSLAKSIFQAKQLITHNKITVNKKIVNKNNFLLKKGDFILRKYGASNKYTQQQRQQYRQEVLYEKKQRKKKILERLHQELIDAERRRKNLRYQSSQQKKKQQRKFN